MCLGVIFSGHNSQYHEAKRGAGYMPPFFFAGIFSEKVKAPGRRVLYYPFAMSYEFKSCNSFSFECYLKTRDCD